METLNFTPDLSINDTHAATTEFFEYAVMRDGLADE